MKIPVSVLRAGLIFSKPVYIDNNNLLVPAGIEIRERDIEQLNEWGIETVETEGDIIGESSEDASVLEKVAAGQAGTAQPIKTAPDRVEGVQPAGQTKAPLVGGAQGTGQKRNAETKKPGIGRVGADHVKAILMNRQANEGQKIDIVFKNYLELINTLNDFFVYIASGKAGDVRTVHIIADRLLQAIKENRVTTIGYILGKKVESHELAKNSINAAILSALIAEGFEFSDQNMRQLVIGALLHDVGMLRLPKEILNKRGWLSPAETQQMQAHTYYSYHIVREELNFAEDIGRIAIQHHERWDGEGYPRHFRGQEIAMGARIVSVVDAFEAMVSEKPYRNSMMGYHAMKNILSDNFRRFDPEVLKVFVEIMGIYPIGSIICLNTGAVARVTDVRGEAPLRPKIRIMIDENGMELQPKEGKIVELLKEKNLFITRAIDPREFAKRA
jgi:HD-GYP domain-containing protein (c-di-GMP phosphodiesterase class II)